MRPCIQGLTVFQGNLDGVFEVFRRLMFHEWNNVMLENDIT